MLSYALYGLLAVPAGSGLAVGLGARFVSPRMVNVIVALAMLIACTAAGYLCYTFVAMQHAEVVITPYVWLNDVGQGGLPISLLLDRLSVVMSLVVTIVAFMVHIYAMAYMHDDVSYQRFFALLLCFTVAMLLVVLANNFLILFAAWEAVGLFSYLLINFWFALPVANAASYKAFCVNRCGDCGLLLGIVLLFAHCAGLDYHLAFSSVHTLQQLSLGCSLGAWHPNMLDLICFLILVGVMSKSAQLPLHVWLPDSMAGPTPVSALLHAATMVAAGIYLIARLHPLFSASIFVESVMLCIGATTCVLMGSLALVEYDIKKIIAYSTLSQLGYMMVALGFAAYSAALIHLIVHAFFKALLFLAAGAVITAMHHEQDIRKMGGLARQLPVVYACFLGAVLSMMALPPLSGFYSKELIIAASHYSLLPGAWYANLCVNLAAMITAMYSVRLLYRVFHGQPAPGVTHNLHKLSWTMLWPLLVLLIPSLCLGWFLVGPAVFAVPNLFGPSFHRALTDVMGLAALSLHYHGPWSFVCLSLESPTLYLVMLGVTLVLLYYTCLNSSQGESLDHWSKRNFPTFNRFLLNRYGFDQFYGLLVAQLRQVALWCYQVMDQVIIDKFAVHGWAVVMQYICTRLRSYHTGYVFNYALIMLCAIGVLLLAFCCCGLY